MATTAARRQQYQQQRASTLREALDQFAEAWEAIDHALEMAEAHADDKYYRSARRLNRDEPLNATIDPPLPPAEATIVATDGSQIMPDRHAAFLYYLVNVGVITYHHCDHRRSSRSPTVSSQPQIRYPEQFAMEGDTAADEESEWQPRHYQVTVERDLAEISTLAQLAWEHRHAAALIGAIPLLAILDQRLLYWPFGGPEAIGNTAVRDWSEKMTKIRDAGAWLAGYIDRPGKMSVVTLLQSLLAGPEFDWKSLGKRRVGLLTDAALFAGILKPGQRSAVFVEVSPSNERFVEMDPQNEVCFFFLNPGQTGQQIARVDIPLWVAADKQAVSAVHSLIYNQCQILGDYPYVLARADELAVVGRQDEAELNGMIDIFMQRAGISGQMTAKQSSKEVARGGRGRHMGL
jgi:hypothetical protein